MNAAPPSYAATTGTPVVVVGSPGFVNTPHVDVDASLAAFCMQYEIKPQYIQFLKKLVHYRTVFLCDDSGSMGELADPDTTTGITRWNELVQLMQISIGVMQVLGISSDVYFINR
jgi:hypothetical protein